MKKMITTINEFKERFYNVKYNAAIPPEYGDSNYKSRNGIIIEKSPEWFLSLVPKLELDEESNENISILKNQILNCDKLDPPTLYVDGNKVVEHDGRHRSYAALQLNIELISILIIDINNIEINSIELIAQD